MTETAVASSHPRLRSHGLAAVTVVDVLAALRATCSAEADAAWAVACAAAGLDPYAPSPTLDELAAVLAELRAMPGSAGLVGRAQEIRLAAYRALSAEGSDRPAPAWDWARRSMDDLIRARTPRPERHSAILGLELFSAATSEVLDRAVRTAADRLGAPTALFTVALEGAAAFAATTGVTGWPAVAGGVPAEWAFCSTMVRTREPYVLPDTTADVLQRYNPLAVQDGVRAYAGVPLLTSTGQVVGSCCVMGDSPRPFAEEEVALLRRLAAETVTELEGRPAVSGAA